jgi:glycosyltransferase involved in cell wall biosynthesis
MTPPAEQTPCAVVIPCYNEEHRLRSDEFLRYLESHPDLTFVFVNDGSDDGTLRVLQKAQAAAARGIEVVHLEANGGKGEAVRRGMLHAMKNTGASVVGFWDADLATPLDAIADLREVLDGRREIEMVFGSRVKLLGRWVERRAVRHYLGRVFATVVSTLLRMPIYDTQCGAKLFRSTEALRKALAEPFSCRWVFDVEMLARFIQQSGGDVASVQGRIYEYPLHVWRVFTGGTCGSVVGRRPPIRSAHLPR